MESPASPTARALLALELIQGSPGITAERLAERLDVSDRAARRYVSILREAGIPIDSVRGPYGGYRVGRGLRIPPLMFEATEAIGLVMAVLDGHHDAADASGPVGRALGKLLRALPEPVARQAEAVRATTAPARDPSAARPDPEKATVLVEACARRHRVLLGYRTEAGTEWQAEVDPWAVVVRHGRWYLLCHSHAADARRAYRVDRVTSVDPRPETFTPPSDLDPVTELEDHLAAGWEYDVEVLIEAPLADVRVPRNLGRLEAVDENTTRLVGSTSNPWTYVEKLLTLRAPYRIVRGAEVQAAARAIGERLLAASSDPAGETDRPRRASASHGAG